MKYRLTKMTLIRKVGSRSFLLNSNFDYSKRAIPQLSDFGVEIAEYLMCTREEEDIIKKFRNSEISREDILEFLRYLINGGYVDRWEKTYDRRFISDLVKTEWKDSRTFYGATFELTPKCNFKCIHCYLGENRYHNDELSTDQIKTILGKLCENGLFMVFLSGGEPLLRKDFIEIYKYARKKGMLVDVFTNGYLINDELISVFEQYPPMEIDISLYGASDEKYFEITGIKQGFTTVSNNIDKLLAKGINVSLKSPIILPLKDSIGDMRKFAQSRNIPFRVAFDVVPDIDNHEIPLAIPPEEIPVLKEKYSNTYIADKNIVSELMTKKIEPIRKRYNCSTGKCSGFVDYKGNFSPCIELRFKGRSLLENDFDDIWKEIGTYAYETISEDDYKCVGCEYLAVCTSCPAIRERMYGSPKIVNERDCRQARLYYEYIKRRLKDERGN
ncbi:MAG: radical SAM protein [Clostridiales bacterium]|nr:radical SAM protein [Clostridiales bacterium]